MTSCEREEFTCSPLFFSAARAWFFHPLARCQLPPPARNRRKPSAQQRRAAIRGSQPRLLADKGAFAAFGLAFAVATLPLGHTRGAHMRTYYRPLETQEEKIHKAHNLLSRFCP